MRADPLARRSRAELARALTEVHDVEELSGDALVAKLASLLAFEHAVAYEVVLEDGRLCVEWAHTRDVGDFRTIVESTIARLGVRPFAFDPLRPEPAQRNRAVRIADLGADANSKGMGELFPRMGVAGKDQLRVLVCDGPALLGWVGGYRSTPFTDEERSALQSLVVPLQNRLRLAEWLRRQHLQLEAIRAVMSAIGAPAFITRVDGRVVHANDAGRAAHDAAPQANQERIRDAIRLRPEGVQVTAIRAPGLPEHFLVVLPPPERNVDARARLIGQRWSLTPRQIDVLALLVRGAANKTIASTLGVSTRTVEVHVTAILQRAQCGSRAELGARFWQAR